MEGGYDPPKSAAASSGVRGNFNHVARARFLGVSAHQQEYTRMNSDAEREHARPPVTQG